MKILIVGFKGMLGRALTAAGEAAGHAVSGVDREEMDIASLSDVAARMPEADWVVNCAGYTLVDRAEQERDAAMAVNAAGAGHVAQVCADRGVPLLHISTDYVFDGSLGRPYTEDDPPRPVNYYGLTKLEGERRVQRYASRHVIVRTQSLFGRHGRNFVDAILSRLDTTQGPVAVVADQTSRPTYVGHLAEAILRLLAAHHFGIVHVAASGICTWHEFACAIAARTGHAGRIERTTADRYAAAARRPAYSALATARYTEWTGGVMPTWEEGLTAYLREIGRIE